MAIIQFRQILNRQPASTPSSKLYIEMYQMAAEICNRMEEVDLDVFEKMITTKIVFNYDGTNYTGKLLTTNEHGYFLLTTLHMFATKRQVIAADNDRIARHILPIGD